MAESPWWIDKAGARPHKKWMQVMGLERKEGNELKYAQQHLANERTFLAWIRTAVAVIGIGFLTTSLHFTVGIHRNPRIDVIAIILGLFSCGFGIAIIGLATISYLHKKRQISRETFVPSSPIILFVAFCMVILIIAVMAYFLFVGF